MDSNISASPPSDTSSITGTGSQQQQPPGLNSNSTRFSFQHFDQESDFGVEDENGERVRKRKRPGRKPNPPTVQERRAQNRAAQRAFREREQKRREEKERENQAHMEELFRLRKRLAEVQYEANYLRGCVLLLCLTSLVERGSVPHIWTDTRLFPIPWTGNPPAQPQDSVNSIPAILRTVLSQDNQILGFQSSLMSARCTGWSLPDQIEQLLKGVDTFIPTRITTLATNVTNATAEERTTRTTTTTNGKSGNNSAIGQQQRQQGQRDQQPLSPSSHQQQQRRSRTVLDKDNMNNDNNSNSSSNSNHVADEDDEMLSPYAETELLVSSFTATKNVVGIVYDTPTLKTPDDLSHLPSLQALHVLKMQLKAASILGDKTRISLTPTALQRLIPHDVRIDYCPGPSLRDRMILFQGFYDPDEVFELLSTRTMFIGGDPRDTRNWVPDPKFSERYWFLSHQLVDHHSGECALIPEFIDAILATQRQKEEELRRFKEEQEEQQRRQEEALRGSSAAAAAATSLSPSRSNNKKSKHNKDGDDGLIHIGPSAIAATSSSSSSTGSKNTTTLRKQPLLSVRKERSSNIRSLPLDL